MFPDQLVVGDVGVQGSNQVVAVTPGVWRLGVALTAVGFAVADQVHPVAGPLFAEVGRVHEVVHQVFVSPRRGIGDEGLDLSGEGWQSPQIVGKAPDQRVPVRCRRRFQPLLLQSGQDEPVHRMKRPIGVGDRRWRDGPDRLPGPVAALARFQVETAG